MSLIKTTESHPRMSDKSSVLKFLCQHHVSKQAGVIVGMSKYKGRQCNCRLSEKLPCEREAGGGGLIGIFKIALPFCLNPSLL